MMPVLIQKALRMSQEYTGWTYFLIMLANYFVMLTTLHFYDHVVFI